jgi:3-methyladenine DNA glycosylase AlkD|tara:strand:+ start:15506 stop:16171 length:666 start_codon:yes stop_codon:yes gene_type:complete
MISEIVDAFQKRHDTERADKMAAYMRNKFEYFGLMSDARKEIQKEFFPRMNKEISSEDRWDFIRELWEKPQRECQYFALDWANTFKPKTFRKEDITQIHFLLVNHSWWDSVDGIAANLLGKYNLQFPENKSAWLNEWRESDNFWLRRSCIIHQLKYKDKTDFELLKSLIKENRNDKEFFIQKAIGWSLRQYAKFQPELVKNFVEQENIQGLARREALKHFK